MRGIKYGLAVGGATFFFMPVVRRLPFSRRFGISLFPFLCYCQWGYNWGHENYWRRAKEVMVTQEVMEGTRSEYTLK